MVHGEPVSIRALVDNPSTSTGAVTIGPSVALVESLCTPCIVAMVCPTAASLSASCNWFFKLAMRSSMGTTAAIWLDFGSLPLASSPLCCLGERQKRAMWPRRPQLLQGLAPVGRVSEVLPWISSFSCLSRDSGFLPRVPSSRALASSNLAFASWCSNPPSVPATFALSSGSNPETNW